jgi:glyoxylase-like metal-dependent hydrolase (beta-lactamase superfamily II)
LVYPTTGNTIAGVVMKKILDGLYMIDGIGEAAVFLIGSNDRFHLIDSGIFKRTDSLISQLEENHFSIKNLQTIYLTHCHCDHIGGVTELVKYSGARVAAHKDDIPFITQQEIIAGPYHNMMAQEQKVMRQFGCNIQKVDIELNDGDILPLLGGLKIISVPGHTPGSIALYQPEKMIMFFGDVIRNNPKKGLVVGIPENFNLDTEQVEKDARLLLSFQIEYALFSHGEPILGNAQNILKQTIA